MNIYIRFLPFICIGLLLVACGGEGTSEPIQYPGQSAIEILSSAESSSETASSMTESSLSEENSSSEILSNSSSSYAKSSSGELKSSSVVKSSSSIVAPPCKTETEDNCEYGTLVDDRDGQTYKTVKIGNQIWMAENLNYAYLQPTSTLDSSSWCYDNDPENCKKYGRLYLWSATMDSAALFSEDGAECGYFKENEPEHKCSSAGFVQGICPEKWHVPSKKEYEKLLVNTQILCKSSDGNQTDYGFDIQPGGFYYAEPDCCSFYPWSEGRFFEYGGETAFLWLASEEAASKAYCDLIHASNCKTDGPTWGAKFFAYSVRCVKDIPDVE